MKRRLFTLAAAVSLLLCLATIVMWCRSYWAWDQIIHSVRLPEQIWLSKHTMFESNWGGLNVRRESIGLFPGQPTRPEVGKSEWVFAAATACKVEGRLTRFSFWVREEYLEMGLPKNFDLSAPWWALSACTAVMPAIWLSKRVRIYKSAMQGRCVACGYDLRATPERCPECGTLPKATKTTQ